MTLEFCSITGKSNWTVFDNDILSVDIKRDDTGLIAIIKILVVL